MPTRPAHRLAPLAALVLLAGAGSGACLVQSASAQPRPVQPAPDTQKQRLELLRDWIHYVRIDQLELARSTAEALINSGITNTELVALVDDAAKITKDFENVVIQAQRKKGIEGVASQLLKMYEEGRLEHARSADEIQRNIRLLTGLQRERLVGRRGLLAAGEYAMPQLLESLLDNTSVQRQAQSRLVVVELGRQAVVPLSTALRGLSPAHQEVVAAVLGDIPYHSSVPFLYDVHRSSNNPRVRDAIERALRQVAGAFNADSPVADRYVALANEYYSENRSLTSFPDERSQLLWSFTPGGSLSASSIATPVYHEAMAMRLSERALELDPANSAALALWVAANFSREIDSPKDYDNPAYPSDRRGAHFFAVAAGAPIQERVLARAIDTRDTPLAHRAIAALDQTAGGASLWSPSSGDSRKPLLEAITYPNRRVQYEAALALGAAQPREPFSGSDRVVPILASAVRDAAAKYALVLARDTEEQSRLADILRSRGYTVLPPAADLAEIEQPLAEAPGADLVVMSYAGLPASATADAIARVRGRPKLAAAPVLALVGVQGVGELTGRYRDDPGIRIAREGLAPEQIAASADQLIEAATGGPVSADEARDYKLKSLAVLRDLAVSRNPVLNAADAAGPLTAALSDSIGSLKLQIAHVLSHFPQKPVQVELMNAALAARGEERVLLLRHVTESAKRHGNQLDRAQVDSLVKLATSSEGDDNTADAAAALMGALNLPHNAVMPLIISAP